MAIGLVSFNARQALRDLLLYLSSRYPSQHLLHREIALQWQTGPLILLPGR